MNLVEKLIKIDKGEFEKTKVKSFKSKRLSEIMGEDAWVTLKELDPEYILQLSQTGVDSEGNPIISKTMEVNALIVASAMVEPDLKDEALMKHFGCPTPMHLAKKLFKGENINLAEKASEMAGMTQDKLEEMEDEIKN